MLIYVTLFDLISTPLEMYFFYYKTFQKRPKSENAQKYPKNEHYLPNHDFPYENT